MKKIKNVPLSFDGDIMTLPIREPTDNELQSLGILWLLPSIESNPRPIRRRRKDPVVELYLPPTENIHANSEDDDISVPEETVLVPVWKNNKKNQRWKTCLGYPTDKILTKTLNTTTQLRAEPIEMENRKFPRQHRKKRLSSLHVRRIPGRVDTDTFFSTINSRRK